VLIISKLKPNLFEYEKKISFIKHRKLELNVFVLDFDINSRSTASIDNDLEAFPSIYVTIQKHPVAYKINDPQSVNVFLSTISQMNMGYHILEYLEKCWIILPNTIDNFLLLLLFSLHPIDH
jgi:hypothetical protein